MSVTLTPEVEAIIQRKVEEGLYADAESALARAVELLVYQDKLERLRALIREGEEGEAVPWTPELMDEIERESEERYLRGELPNPDVCP